MKNLLNIEVIDALEELVSSVAYTNDVIKNGEKIKPKAESRPHFLVEIVELHH